MFAQFRSKYPQGRILTEMLSKIDGLHAFRATVSQGDEVLGTATAVDSDLEIAEDRAVKRALTFAGISFDSGYEQSFGGYNGRSPMLTQVSRETDHGSSLSSANVTHALPSTQTIQSIASEPELEYSDEYTGYTPSYAADIEDLPPEPKQPVIKASIPPMSTEPIDLSDAISKIDVEMGRLNWTKRQGRDYLVRTFEKKSRQELTHDELSQFLSYLKSLPTPHRSVDSDEF
ncbi:MAG: hypothetical protein NW214_13780 [Pseudanabaenaceae cyanobacterium bins.39]|nr:hypothetical protein [Pseudanabaenaceae cyanobacterium bins.39]